MANSALEDVKPITMDVESAEKQEAFQVARSVDGLANEVYIYLDEKYDEKKEVYTYTLTLYRLGGVDATDEELYEKYFPRAEA